MQKKEWNINLNDSTVLFYLPSDSASSCGQLKLREAKFVFNEDDLSGSKLFTKINLNSLWSNDSIKTHQILSEEFLDQVKFPETVFKANSFSRSKNGYCIKGELTLKGKTKTEIVNFSITSLNGIYYFNGIMEFYAGDYCVMKKSKSGSDKVKVIIRVPIN